eukprot:1185553-Prymnesium_polylepis.1
MESCGARRESFIRRGVALDAREGQLFNIGIKGPSLTTVFICLVAFLTWCASNTAYMSRHVTGWTYALQQRLEQEISQLDERIRKTGIVDDDELKAERTLHFEKAEEYMNISNTIENDTNDFKEWK